MSWWAVIVLLLFYTLSFLDRAILNLLVVPIQRSLDVSDVQISLLQGLAFAAFYAALGIPLGWAVDRYPRRRIIFLGVIIWSLATAASGLASRYVHLLLARIGVGGGEAALAPAGYSLISDLFPANRMALPMSVMGVGGAVGTALAAISTGVLFNHLGQEGISLPLLGQVATWQIAFLVAGAPGLLLAPIIYTVPEPQRKGITAVAKGPSFGPAAISYIWKNRGFYLPHFIGFGLISMCNYGTNAWLPAFLTRVHGLTVSNAAFSIGALSLMAVVPGGIAIGAIVDRWYGSGRRDAHMRFFAFSILAQATAITLALHVSSIWLCYAFVLMHHIFSSFTGVAATALQIRTPNQYRGQVSAIYLLVFNLIGLGLGPLAVATLTDSWFGDRAQVGHSIAMVYIMASPMACLLLLAAGRRMRALAGS